MKIAYILLITFFSTSLLAQDEKPLVIATASMIADMVQNIGGEFINVKCIVPIGGDPHIYEPTPGDAILASKADLVLKNGLTFEGWLSELIENSGTKADIVRVTEGIEPITSLSYKNAPDPHAWMDVELGIVYAENIKNALVDLLPDRKKEIQFNFNAYKSTLQSLHQLIQDKIAKIPKARRILITSHDAFQYYGRKYGLKLEAALGTSTDAQVQTSDIKRLNKVIASSGVPSIFIETTVNPKLIKQIAEDNNVDIGGKLYSDSLGDEDSEAPTYVDMLKYNTETIVSALTKKVNQKDLDKKTKSGFNLAYLIPIGLILTFIILLLIRKFSK